jgi:hypothetical protein
MLIFYATDRRRKASIYKSTAGAGALGTAKPQDGFLPAGKIKTRHEDSRLKSVSALWTAVLLVPFVTIPEGRVFEPTIYD